VSARGLVAGLGLLGTLGLASACKFEPDLSRYDACAEDGTCAPGYTCLAEERLCLPDCGSECTPEPADAGTDGGPGDSGTGDGPGDEGQDGGGGMDAGADTGDPLSLATLALPPATETLAYTATLVASGGKPPYVFRPTESLPQGFVLDGGVLSGNPATPGTFRVAVEVRDQGSPPSRVGTTYDLRVRPLLRIAGPEVLVNGYLNNAYAEQVFVTGGTPPYSFALASGNAPPAGLTLETDGGVKGTPSASGQHFLQVRVMDSDPQSQTVGRQLELNISSAPLLLAWSTQSVPDGRVGTPYRYVLQVAAAGGSTTWKLEAGSTPPGIGFNATTATLLGTPTDPGVYSFTISAASGISKVSATFDLTVY
jgi:hypothetical protein